MHIFPYSSRPGTPADKMPGQHDNATKEARSRAAIAVAAGMEETFLQAQTGSVQEVLFEELSGEFWVGHTPNYVKVYARGENLHNEVRSVLLGAIHNDGILGTVVSR